MKNRFFNFFATILVIAVAMFSITSCDKEDDNGGENPVLVEDGYYVQGSATGMDNPDLKYSLDKGREEGEGFASLERDGMFEGIFYLGIGEFTIFHKAGATETTYGTDAVEMITLAGADSQIHGDVLKGTYKANGAAVSIPQTGLYHIVIDETTTQIMVSRLNSLAVIGNATPGQWDAETVIPEVSITSEGAVWKVEDVVLREGSFKFRYNNGWKIALTDLVVFTNYGGDDTGNGIMGGGGWSVAKEEQGIYTIECTWSPTAGFEYTLTKTGDLSETDWTGVVLDLVGDGVSATNANAIDDPSGWTWGRKLLADNNGLPNVQGSVYTWKWTAVKLVADAGFKVRTENGVAPANGNGAGFDIGYAAIDVDNSSANIADVSGNMSVTVAAEYTIIITIDAANGDAKTVTISEPKLYMTGSALGGWDWDTNFVELTWVSGQTFEATTEFAVEAFRFFAQAGWGDSYNYPYFTTVDANFENSNDTDQNLKFIGTPGNYKITVDLVAKTVVLEAAN